VAQTAVACGKAESMKTILTVDGGCLNNGASNAQAYGSIRIQAYNSDNLVVSDRIERFKYDDLHTNNTAEIRTLYQGLQSLLKAQIRTQVIVQTDSQLLVGWVILGWKRNDSKCNEELDRVDQIITNFNNLKLVKVPRDEIVKLLGH
jgi:ribonuclease HI